MCVLYIYVCHIYLCVSYISMCVICVICVISVICVIRVIAVICAICVVCTYVCKCLYAHCMYRNNCIRCVVGLFSKPLAHGVEVGACNHPKGSKDSSVSMINTLVDAVQQVVQNSKILLRLGGRARGLAARKPQPLIPEKLPGCVVGPRRTVPGPPPPVVASNRYKLERHCGTHHNEQREQQPQTPSHVRPSLLSGVLVSRLNNLGLAKLGHVLHRECTAPRCPV